MREGPTERHRQAYENPRREHPDLASDQGVTKEIEAEQSAAQFVPDPIEERAGFALTQMPLALDEGSH